MPAEGFDVLNCLCHLQRLPGVDKRTPRRTAVVHGLDGYVWSVGRDLAGSIVVITGASSGIGRAAALEFARRGAGLLLASRAPEPLEDVAAECSRSGVRALAVPTDVRDEHAVHALAERAVDSFGRLDVWVNCAGVMAYGRFEQVPTDVFRAVIETNLFGQVHGARAALPIFRQQGSGVLINMASVWGRVTAPDVSAYVTSKFAVRAFGECLREELRSAPGIDVATMLPQAVDTPIFDRAANFAGHPARPIPPLVDPETVASGIVKCAQSPKREVTYSRVGRFFEFVHSLTPGLYERLLPPAFEAGNYGDGPSPPTSGATLHPSPNSYEISGRWKEQRRRELARALSATLRGFARGVRGR
jgi:NAD(P)-dependent dehydrogenase (short-subunit alcohol dehydrogenase family)